MSTSFEMGERAHQLGTRLGEFLEGTTEMHRIGCEEDEIDRQHRRLFAAMTAPGEWFHSIAVALDILRLDIYYERFTDHAVAIAHRVHKLNRTASPHKHTSHPGLAMTPRPPATRHHRRRKAGQGDGAKYGQVGKICPAPEGFCPSSPHRRGFSVRACR